VKVFEFAVEGGVLVGLFYCLMSLGLNLSFGVLRILNVAHGNVVIFTAYLTWEIVYSLGWNPLIAMGLAAPVAFFAGLLTHYLIAPRLARSSDPEMFSLVFFFGIAQALEAITTQAFSSNPRSINQGFMTGAPVAVFGQSFPEVWVVAAVITVPVVLILAWYLYRTRLGRATQALMSNPEDAQATGINIQRTAGVALGISFLLAALAGPFTIFINGSIDPSSDVQVTTIAFAVIIIGGLGNPLATVLGGLIYGITYELVQSYQPSWSDAVPYVLLVLILLVRPSGLLGHAERSA
jgi:branched-chain amino acid transport system permease protein